MKKKFIIALILLLFACAGVFSYFMFFNDGLVLRVGIECNYPPNNWEEMFETDSNVPLENNRGRYAEGYDVQIAKRVAASMGLKLEVKKFSWDDLVPALNRNEIDAVFSGMLDTSDRKKLIDFSDVYGVQEIQYSVLVHRDGKYSKAKKIADFAGARFIGQRNTNLDRGIYQLPGVIRLPAVNTFSEMLMKLLNHEVDGIIADSETAGANEKLHHELVRIKFDADETFFFDYTGICAGVRKNNAALAEKINAALSSITKHDRQTLMLRALEKSERLSRR